MRVLGWRERGLDFVVSGYRDRERQRDRMRDRIRNRYQCQFKKNKMTVFPASSYIAHTHNISYTQTQTQKAHTSPPPPKKAHHKILLVVILLVDRGHPLRRCPHPRRLVGYRRYPVVPVRFILDEGEYSRRLRFVSLEQVVDILLGGGDNGEGRMVLPLFSVSVIG